MKCDGSKSSQSEYWNQLNLDPIGNVDDYNVGESHDINMMYGHMADELTIKSPHQPNLSSAAIPNPSHTSAKAPARPSIHITSHFVDKSQCNAMKLKNKEHAVGEKSVPQVVSFDKV